MERKVKVVFTLVIIALCSTATNLQDVSITSDPADTYQVATIVNLTCNVPEDWMDLAYQWSSNCSSGDCFPLYKPYSSQISTLDRSKMKALTSFDVGTHSCSVTGTGVSGSASVQMNVQGVGVFDQVSLSTVYNKTYYTADSSGYLNVELHCIGANGAGEWKNPDGMTPSENVFFLDFFLGSAVLAHTRESMEDIGSADGGSASGSDLYFSGNDPFLDSRSVAPFNDSSKEGFYKCIAIDENGNKKVIYIGLFLNGRVEPTITSLNITSNPALLETQIIFTCDAQVGSPPAIIYTWYLNGDPLAENSSSLTVNLTNDNQYGNYTCSISNIVGTESETITLEQGYRPEITLSPDVKVKSPNAFTIQCNVTGYPPPNVYWINGSSVINSYTFYDGNVLTSSIMIHQSEAVHSGVYTCVAENEFNTVNDSVMVNVFVEPLILSAQDHYIAIDNTSVNISCTATGVPIPNITWYRIRDDVELDKRPLDTEPRIIFNTASYQLLDNEIYERNQTIIFQQVNMSDTGTYSCEASNSVGNTSNEFNITVQYSPIIIERDDQNITVIQTKQDNVSFNCSVIGEPIPNIYWIYGDVISKCGDVISNSTKYVITYTEEEENEVTSTLVITEPGPLDTGVYSCYASNILGYDIVHNTLTVNVLPTILSAQDHYIAIDNTSVNISCTATGVPIPNITWYRIRDDVELDKRPLDTEPRIIFNTASYQLLDNEIYKRNQIIIFQQVNMSDTGTYSCEASNSVGNTSNEFNITVQYSPIIIERDDQDITVIQTKQDNVSFNCSAIGEPIPNIYWIYSGDVISNSTKYVITYTEEEENEVTSTLVITEPGPLDTGVYSCNASNILGYDIVHNTLTVNVIPAISKGPVNYTVIQPDNITFNCSSTGYPRPIIKWYRIEDQNVVEIFSMENYKISFYNISDDGVFSELSIFNTNPFDSLIYICNSSNVAGFDNASNELVVLVKPQITSSQDIYTVNEFSPVSFQCSAIGIPIPSITWYRNDIISNETDSRISIKRTEPNHLSSLVFETNQTLTITGVQDNDTDVYSCMASSDIANDSTTFDLIVHYATRLIRPVENITITEYNNTILICVVEGRLLPSVLWWANTISNDDYVELFNDTNISIVQTVNGFVVTSYLTLLTIPRSFHGNYKCNASNNLGSVDSTAFLTVYYAPAIIGNPVNTTVVSPENATFSCETEGRPRPTIQWLYNSSSIINGPHYMITESQQGETYNISVLTVLSVIPFDDGLYECVTSNLVEDTSESATLTVHVNPTVLHPPMDQMYIVNQSNSLVLTCNSSGIPSPFLIWKKEGTELSSDPSGRITLNPSNTFSHLTGDGVVFLTEQSLNITLALGNDTGNFSCSGVNFIGNDTKYFYIFVQVPPVVVPEEGDRHIISIEDTETIIAFDIINAAPDVTPQDIQWTFSSKFTKDPFNETQDISGLQTRVGDSKYTYSMDNRSLTINGINQTDEGRYFLIATNPAGVHYNHIDIIVHGPPKLIVSPSNQTIIDDHNVTFMCEAIADPPHNVSWLFNNTTPILSTEEVVESKKYSLNRDPSLVSLFGSLTVYNVQYEDRGVYQCTVKNYVDSITAMATLTVHVSPVIHAISNSTSLNISESLTLFCLTTGYPLSKVTWKMNGIIIPFDAPDITMETIPASGINNMIISDEFLQINTADISHISQLGSVGLLKFSAVQRSATGIYTCTASNSLASTTLQATSTEITVTVLEKPDSPISVTVVSTTSRSVQLSWIPGFNGNRETLGYNIYQKDYDNDLDFVPVSSNPGKYTTTLSIYNITSGIVPYTKYVFRVIACNELGCGVFDNGITSSPYRTQPDAPDTPPRYCQASSESSTSMNVSWILPEKPNGLIEYYIIIYTPLKSLSGVDYNDISYNLTTPTNISQLIIPGLLKATTYRFSLIAHTVIGGSPPSNNTCQQTTLEDVPEQPPKALDAVSPTSTSIRLSWNLPDQLYWNGIITRHRITYSTVSFEIGNVTTHTLSNLDIYTTYNIQVSSGTDIGFGPARNVIKRTLNDTSTSPRNVKVTSVNKTNIALVWDPPQSPNGVISSYKIYYEPHKDIIPDDDTYDSSERVIDVTETQITLTDLYPATEYRISVTSVNGAGESDRSESVTTNTPPDAPSMIEPPIIGNEDGRQVRITLVKPSTLNGEISHYQVIAVLLPSSSLPDLPPDVLFPSLESFLTYSNILNKDSNEPVAYIVGEFSDDLFPEDSMYTIGDEDEPDDKDYRNGPLKYGSSFTFFLRAYPSLTDSRRSERQVTIRQYSEFSSSGYTAVITTASDPTPNIIIGSVVGTLLFVILIVIIVVVIVIIVIYTMRRRQVLEFKTNGSNKLKRNQSEVLSITSDFSFPSLPTPGYLEIETDANGINNQYVGHFPIPSGEFGKIVDRLHANDNYLFSQEYEEICHTSPHLSVDVCLNPMNKSRNRYANIQCYDHSRVTITPIEGHPHDYINANFLSGYNKENEYIATQGPLPDTVSDFWRMVWDNEVPTIVMLTALVEKMRVKCSRYWPENVGTTEQFANISVTLTRCVTHADYCIRHFEIQAEGEKDIRLIKQFHYLSWPDFGVPRHPTPLLQFIRVVRRHHKYNDNRSMIVHCSAGVGRTGTFSTIDVEMQRLQHDSMLNPYSFVRSMRENRNHMVQTEAQYIFIHDALMEVMTTGLMDISVEKLGERIAELEEEDDEGETGYSNEFMQLKSSQQQHFNEYSSAQNEANKYKNRILNALPYDHNRVKLTKSPGEVGSDYINASFIDGYKEKNVFIATQGPLNNTVHDFWRMIWEQQTSVIVMLTKTEERGQEMSQCYWPRTTGAEVNFGPLTVQNVSEKSLDDYTHRQLKITYSTRDTSVSHFINHYQFMTWPKNGAPKSGSGMIDLIDQVTRNQQKTGNKPIIVHCSAGIGRTGTFCALSIAIERIKTEHLVNIFDTVKHLRTQRPHMVQTLDQYIFCYRAVLEYVDSMHTYANVQ